MNILSLSRSDLITLVCFIIVVLAGPVILEPFGAGYPDLLQKFAMHS